VKIRRESLFFRVKLKKSRQHLSIYTRKKKKKKKKAIKYKETCGMGIAIPLIFVILNQYFKNFVLVFVSVFLGKVERKWN
jgi:hypothetical protein